MVSDSENDKAKCLMREFVDRLKMNDFAYVDLDRWEEDKPKEGFVYLEGEFDLLGIVRDLIERGIVQVSC